MTGKTLAENLAGAAPLSAGQQVIQPIEQPVLPRGHIRILRGNLAPDGAVAKITGKEGERFAGPARSTTPKKRCSRGSNETRSPRDPSS